MIQMFNFDRTKDNLVFKIFIFLVLNLCSIAAANEIVFDEANDLIKIEESLEVLQHTEAFNIETLFESDAFEPVTIWNKIGYQADFHYFRFIVSNPYEDEKTVLIINDNRALVFSELYSSKDKKISLEKEIIRLQTDHVRVNLVPGTNKFIWKVRFGHQRSTNFFMRPEVSAEAYFLHIMRRSALPFGCYGVIIGLLLHSLFLYSSIKEKIYLYYSIYVVAVWATLFLTNGYFFPVTSVYPSYGLLPTVTNLVVALAVNFTVHYLETENNTPRLHRHFVKVRTLAFSLSIVALGGEFYPVVIPYLTYLTDANMIVAVLFAMSIAYFQIRAHRNHAIYYLISWLFIIIGTAVWFADRYRLLPEFEMLRFSVNLGIAFQMIALSLGLGEKVNEIRRDLLQSQRNLNRDLEGQVAKRTDEIRLKNSKMTAIFESLDQVILQIDFKGNIEEFNKDKYERLFKDPLLHVKNIFDLLLQCGQTNEQVTICRNVVELCDDESFFNFEVNSDLLVRDLVLHENGSVKFIRIDWNCIVDPSTERIARILTVLKDVTSEREALKIQEQQSFDTRLLMQALQIERVKAQDFVVTSRNLISRIAEASDIDEIKFCIHTFKGNARMLGFLDLSDDLHSLENLISSCLPLELEQLINHSMKKYTQALTYMNQFLIVDSDTSRTIDSYMKRSIIKEIESDNKNPFRPGVVLLKKIKEYDDLSMVMVDVVESVFRSRKVILQNCFNIDIHPQSLLVKNEYIATLKNCMNHLVNNSIDHGFYALPDCERSQFNVYCQITIVNETVIILYSDNGAGFDLGKIQALHLASGGQTSATKENLVELIFKSEFSTAETISDTSGRAVGMAAVRAELKKIGGTIVASEKTNGQRGVQFTISVPLEYFIYLDQLQVSTYAVSS